MQGIELRQARNQPVAEQRGNDRQPQLRAEVAPACGGRGRFNGLDGRLDGLQIFTASLGQHAAPALALEEGKAQVLFQPGDGAADAALGDIQLLGCQRVAAQARGRRKGVQLGKRGRVHAHDGRNYDGLS